MRDGGGRYGRRTLLKAAGAAVASAACDFATTPTAPPATASATMATTAAARPTGRIAVYSALDDVTNDRLIAGFRASYAGTAVDLLPPAAAGELKTRIRVEKASPKADIFLGGDGSLHADLRGEGLLAQYSSANSSAIAAEAKDPDGHWTGWYLGIFGFVSNTDRLTKEVGGRKPKTWDDLLDPAWKGRLVLPDPARAAGGYVFLAIQILRFDKDEDRAMEFMKKMHSQVARYVGTESQVIDVVAQGQIVGGPGWSHDILTARAQNHGIELAVPEDTGFEIGAVSILRGSKNVPVARAFVDWMLSREAGELNARLGNRVPVRRDVQPAPGLPTPSHVKLVADQRRWANENRDRLIRKWRAAVGI